MLIYSIVIRRGFAPSFVNYKKGCTRLAAARDKVYQLLAQGRWFSPGTPASSTTKTGRHDIAEILLKVVLNTKIQNSNSFIFVTMELRLTKKLLVSGTQIKHLVIANFMVIIIYMSKMISDMFWNLGIVSCHRYCIIYRSTL